MHPLNCFQRLAAHQSLWERFHLTSKNQQFPQALLIIGPQHVDLMTFSLQMAATLQCMQDLKPCGACKSCRLIKSNTHPGIYYLQPEENSAVIKIDQIRELQTIAFIPPQLGNKRIVIISPAEKMNIAAANALLKILEEPPSCIIFILISEQISTLAPTILSRCQQWRFTGEPSLENYLTIGENSLENSLRKKMFSHFSEIVNDLLDLMNKKTTFCDLASRWSNFELKELIWLFYLLVAQLIYYQFFKEENTTNVYTLSSYFSPPLLFKQLDEIILIIKKLNANVSMNQTLTVENLLTLFIN